MLYRPQWCPCYMAAVTIKNFLAREANLDGAIQEERGLGHDDFGLKGSLFPRSLRHWAWR